jgi:hypothetical protein
MNSPLCPDEALPAGLHSCVSPPVLLNGWKHHLGFVSDRLNQWVRESPGNFPGLVDGLKCLGAAQFDLYTGALAPAEIGLEVRRSLEEHGFLEPRAYADWLAASGRGYREFVLSDGSAWTLLPGTLPSCHIHIHPSRRSPRVMRVRANHFRSAILLAAWAQLTGTSPKPIALNHVRRAFLNLSPVKEEGTGNMIRLTRRILDGH